MANPAPPRPSPGVARVAFSGTYDVVDWANVMHTYTPQVGAHTQQAADQLAIQMHNEFAAHFCPVLAQNLSLQQTQVTMYAPNDAAFESVVVSPAAGQDSGVGLPANVALVVSWSSNAHIRGGHPRTYLAGIVNDRIATGKSWSQQTIADFQAAASNFRQGVNNILLPIGGDVTLGYLQRFPRRGSLQVPPIYLDPPIFWPFTGVSVHSRIDSQRRRLGRETT